MLLSYDVNREKYKSIYQQWTQKPRQSIMHQLKRRHIQSDAVQSDADLQKLINLSTQSQRFALDQDMLFFKERQKEKSFKSTNNYVMDPLQDQTTNNKK